MGRVGAGAFTSVNVPQCTYLWRRGNARKHVVVDVLFRQHDLCK